VAQTLREVLRYGKKTRVIPAPHSDQPMDTGLSLCIKNGWLYDENPIPSIATRHYVFASPLHAWYIQWKLLGNPENVLENVTVTDFALKVIRSMTPLSLFQQREIGSLVQSVPEAQFQDEFYHACSIYTKNCLVSFPEFGTRHGRIDFFIPSKKWGIELLRNGNRLLPHIERFTEGEYGRWISSGIMNDYVVLDFRCTVPAKMTHNGKVRRCQFYIR